MNRLRRRFDFFIKDMTSAMSRILDYTEGKTYQDFENDLMLRDAVIRNFEIIGESVKHIPYKFQRKYKHIPWQHMFAMRNFIVHEFFDIDDEILWEIIVNDLRKNLQDLKTILSTANFDYPIKRK